MTEEYLTLLDWRRRVADMYSAVRGKLPTDAAGAHALWRSTRDALFRSHPQSPLLESDRPTFSGLPYYDYDPRFAKRGKVRPLPEERYDVGTSTGGVIPFVRFGAVDLDVGSLEVFWLEAYSGGVFLPFRDATAGKTTYGGGRYLLDTAQSAGPGAGGAEPGLDFNFAYHPTSPHDAKRGCSLAPLGNRVQVAIEAGERM